MSQIPEPNLSPDPIVARKQDHIRLALSEGSQIKARGHGFDAWQLPHQALPELAFADIDTRLKVLDKELAAPLLIASMTGGPDQGATINLNLAKAAQNLNLGMGLGSLRVIFEQPETLSSFQVRQIAPDILLLANLGAVQLNHGFTAWHCREAVNRVGADALYLHLNALQEVIQPEGDTDFSGLTEHIAEVCSELSFPVLAKECGNGLSA
ncbi:MAG: type 2 isopentenyl-diphosphate Delta-isomerase, partial [Candidatus Melainabacteria bacterium HGW-Melainabacteria-1]